uniref:DUF4177 domain-containing protein n=1 Tax=Trichocoleus desertorum TaxID=1481672 RepID=UPI0025B48C6B|nr:DUF4177 domain-containing protein [Trichocoleus desertorum]
MAMANALSALDLRKDVNMFEYKFVKAPVAYGNSNEIEVTACENVVAEHASQGWRLVQILVANPAVIPSEYVLIFEHQK